jgi:hypothetical protein
MQVHRLRAWAKRGQAPLCAAPSGPFRQRCLTPFRPGSQAIIARNHEQCISRREESEPQAPFLVEKGACSSLLAALLQWPELPPDRRVGERGPEAPCLR